MGVSTSADKDTPQEMHIVFLFLIKKCRNKQRAVRVRHYIAKLNDKRLAINE